MKCRTFTAMIIGPRNTQEDAITDGRKVFQADFLTRKNGFSADTFMLAVCDGMGGHEGGELASMFVCEKLAEVHWKDVTKGVVMESLAGIQQEAMFSLPRNSGTTVAGLLVNHKRAIAFNAGDSRIYRLTHDDMQYVSHDHSLIQEMIDQSLIKAESGSHHPLRNIIELGIGPAFQHAWSIKKIHLHETELTFPSHYLLCSDGLTDILEEKEIHDLLMPNPVDNGTRLYNALKQRTLRDNTSFVIVEIL